MKDIPYLYGLPFPKDVDIYFGNVFSTLIPNKFDKCEDKTLIVQFLDLFENKFRKLANKSLKGFFTKCINSNLDINYFISTYSLLCSISTSNKSSLGNRPALYNFINAIKTDEYFYDCCYGLHIFKSNSIYYNGSCHKVSSEFINVMASTINDVNNVSDRKYLNIDDSIDLCDIKLTKTSLLIKTFLNVLRYSFGSPQDCNLTEMYDGNVPFKEMFVSCNDINYEVTMVAMLCREYIRKYKLTHSDMLELYLDILDYIGFISKNSIIHYTDGFQLEFNLRNYKPIKDMFGDKNNHDPNIAFEDELSNIDNIEVIPIMKKDIDLFSNISKSNSKELNVVSKTLIPIDNKDKQNNSKSKSIQNKLDIPNNISKFVTNLNECALNSNTKIVGRDKELEQCIMILNKIDRHNIMLLGESGVGKTAIVEALAYKLAHDDVPEYLQNKIILSVNQCSLVSGTMYRGDFEERTNNVLNFAKENKNIILYFDEIHTADSTGAAPGGALSLLDILKPYLSENNSQVIASTTNKEYNQTIYKDKAMVRRFQNVTIVEPDKEMVKLIYNANIDKYKKHYNINVSDNIFDYLYDRCNQYINNIKFPDKLFNVLDNCGSFCSIHNKNIIDNKVIDTIISNLTNVPMATIKSDLKTKIDNFKNTISNEIIGQEEAIDNIIKTLKICSIGINETNRPLSSFMFIGSTGVGKTQIAKTLAKEWFGSESKLIRLDMSECANSFDTSKLLGSAAGYLGYDDKNNFVEKVKNNPYSVVLFDEIEKAHTKVINILLQILDEGFVTDSSGEKIDFTNTIIIMTSNCGATDVKLTRKAGFNKSSNDKDIKDSAYKKALYNKFNPEFINRIDSLVIFNDINKDTYFNISKKFITELAIRINNIGYDIKFDDSVINYVANQNYELDMGARPIKRFIKDNIESYIADMIINNELSKDVSNIYYDEQVNKLITKCVITV